MVSILNCWAKIDFGTSPEQDASRPELKLRPIRTHLLGFPRSRLSAMPQVGTFFLFLWRDLSGFFTGWNGIASHRFLEPGR